MRNLCFIIPNLLGMSRLVVFLLACSFGSWAKGQVLQPLGNGVPGKVVASYAAGNEYVVLFDETSTPDNNDFTAATWDGVHWTYYPGLTTPALVEGTQGTYNFHSVVRYHDTLYAAAYIAEAAQDASNAISHLYRWDKTEWVQESSIASTNYGIMAMTVYDDKLIVAGRFTNQVNGVDIQNIAAYDGTAWAYLGSSSLEQGTDGAIKSLLVLGSRLYIAGDFQYFASTYTGNIAYYTASNGEWGGIGSPFSGEVLDFATVGSEIYALGQSDVADYEIRKFIGTGWSDPLGFDTFSIAEPRTIAGAPGFLMIGGQFEKGGNGSSLIRYESGAFALTGNRITGTFQLGQRGDDAFIWGDFTEQNTGIRHFSNLENSAGNLVGDVYFDANSSCSKESTEPGIPLCPVRLENKATAEVYFAITDEQGHFSIALPAGDYQLTLQAGRYLYSVCSNNQTTRIRQGLYASASLGHFQQPSIQDLEVHLVPVSPSIYKAGESARFLMTVVNHGSSKLSGPTLHLTHDASLTQLQSNPSPSNYDGTQAVFTLVDLPAFGSQTYEVELTLATDADPDNFKPVSLHVGSFFTKDDKFADDNSDTLMMGPAGGGDLPPSVSKESLAGDEIDYRNTSWTYRVDFLNTSSGFVKRAVMIDTLDSRLPLKRLLVTDHYPLKANLSIVQGRILVVEFPEANLSSLESNSASAGGFVQYQVDLTKTLALKQEIDNTAWVDFDSRFLESSETCTVTMQDLLSSVHAVRALEYSVYPNPGTTGWNLEFSSVKNRQWQLMDASGKILRQGTIEGLTLHVPATELAPGAYLIQVEGQSTVLLKR